METNKMLHQHTNVNIKQLQSINVQAKVTSLMQYTHS